MKNLWLVPFSGCRISPSFNAKEERHGISKNLLAFGVEYYPVESVVGKDLIALGVDAQNHRRHLRCPVRELKKVVLLASKVVWVVVRLHVEVADVAEAGEMSHHRGAVDARSGGEVCVRGKEKGSGRACDFLNHSSHCWSKPTKSEMSRRIGLKRTQTAVARFWRSDGV